MIIINYKLKSIRLAGAIIAGSLFGETLVNASPNEFLGDSRNLFSRAIIIDRCHSGEFTADELRQLTPEQFGAIHSSGAYFLICSNESLRNVLTADQIAALEPDFINDICPFELSDDQLTGVTLEQLKMLGECWVSPLDLEKIEQLKAKLNPEQREALAFAEARSGTTQQLFDMLEKGEDQEMMVTLAAGDISLRQRRGRYGNLFYAACHHGAFDFALYLLSDKNAQGYMADEKAKIAFLWLKNLLGAGNLSEPDRGKVIALTCRMMISINSGWLQQTKPLIQNPDELRTCCQGIDAWMQAKGNDYEEYPPELREVFFMRQ
jgi:hypothetical protein